MIDLICENIKIVLYSVGKWIDLMLYPLDLYYYFYFYGSFNNTKINIVECFYLNWVGYLLSNNPNYYWIFWELINPSSKLYKYKIYYYIPWHDTTSLDVENIFKNME